MIRWWGWKSENTKRGLETFNWHCFFCHLTKYNVSLSKARGYNLEPSGYGIHDNGCTVCSHVYIFENA